VAGGAQRATKQLNAPQNNSTRHKTTQRATKQYNAPQNNTTRHKSWYLGRFLANFARANALQEASADAEHVRGVREPFWTRAT
jgi:hypothetical protein